MSSSLAPAAPAHAARRGRFLLLSAIAATIGIAFFLPMLWVLTSSLRPGNEAFEYLQPLTWQSFITLTPTFENYTSLVGTELGRAIVNSILVSGATVVIGLIICAMAAFALAAIPFRGRNLVFVLVIVSLLIPFDAVAIPLADQFRDLGLQNTFIGLVLPGIASGMAIFLLRTFFMAIPSELVEAARIDGLGWWGIFRRIYLPLSRPALIGAGLILFLFQWHAYVWPLLIGTDPDRILGPVALANMKGQYAVDFGALFAGSMVLTLIPLALIVAGQRYFVQSASTTGIK